MQAVSVQNAGCHIWHRARRRRRGTRRYSASNNTHQTEAGGEAHREATERVGEAADRRRDDSPAEGRALARRR